MRIKLLLLLLLPALLLAGCEQHGEIGDMAVVLGMAIEKAADGQLLVTAELAHRDSINGSDKSVVVSAAAKNWDKIEESLARACDKRLYWGHLVLLLIDESCGGDGIADILQRFYLDQRLSPTIYTAVCQNSGAEIINSGFGESPYASQGIAQRLSLAKKDNDDICFTVDQGMRRLYGNEDVVMTEIAAEGGKAEFQRAVNISGL